MYALAIDAGSSSVRAALYDREGSLVPGSLTQIDIELTVLGGGGVVAGPALARRAIEQAIDTNGWRYRRVILTVDDPETTARKIRAKLA